MIGIWNRLAQGIWKRLRPVVNTLKKVVLLLCGGEVAVGLKTNEKKMLETPVVQAIEEPVKIKTGDLVKTINNWNGWITLGIAYEYTDAPRNLCDCPPLSDYIYIQAINGQIAENDLVDLTKLGGYRRENIEVISSNMEQ
jgi:hypothetical protein